MYQFAYSAICQELPATAGPASSYETLPDAIELIEAAGKARPASHEQLQLLSEFRRLWLAISTDLIRASQDLPGVSQADMLSAAHGVLEEIERRRFKQSCPRPNYVNPPSTGLLL
jgi:flagellar biosynthesis regulator FlaF